MDIGDFVYCLCQLIVGDLENCGKDLKLDAEKALKNKVLRFLYNIECM